MPETTSARSNNLRLERSFDASREAVFDAWTDPEVLRRWWAAKPAWRSPAAEVDLKVGGHYRLTMEDPDSGTRHIVGGEYTEVRRPERLVYTWRWEGGEDNHESVVSVDFIGQGDRTTVVLEHTRLESPESRDGHRDGWTGCLDSLEARVFSGS